MIFRRNRKPVSPLKAIVVIGTLGILIVVAGTARFFQLQDRLLEEVKNKEAAYLDLVDFRGKLIEFTLSRTELSQPESVAEKPSSRQKEEGEILFYAYENLLALMQKASLSYLPVLHAGRGRGADLFAPQNILFLRLELEHALQQARIESRESQEKLVALNHFFLFFITAILLTLGMTAGGMLHHSYRQTLIPLAQLSLQLKRLNRNIPESIHDTAEEMKKELTESEHSLEITHITESIMNFCGDIEEKNKKLDELHIRDEKTNLYNYRHFKEHLIIEVERAKRLGDKVSLAMIDIDYFKLYNDSNGHIVGDDVLKGIADIISMQCRASDVPSRFGGEEFALLFPKTSSFTARDIAERLRKIISADPFPNEKDQPDGQLTVSVGTATYPDDATDWYTLVNNADKALYMAKSSGRNRVVTFASMESENLKSA